MYKILLKILKRKGKKEEATHFSKLSGSSKLRTYCNGPNRIASGLKDASITIVLSFETTEFSLR